MPQEETSKKPWFEIGKHIPSAELLYSMEEVDQCMKLFNQAGFLDYLNSLNKFYLAGKGEIKDPKPIIVSNFEEGEIIDSPEALQLGGRAWGGADVSLLWKKNQIKERQVTISLRYTVKYEYLRMVLTGSETEEKTQENKPTKSKYLTRTFHLNPSGKGFTTTIDGLLMSFTGEIVDAGILKI
jgi:hypothetical protein